MSRAAILSKTKRLITLPWRAARALKSTILSVHSIELKVSALDCQLREAEAGREKVKLEIFDRLSALASESSGASEQIRELGALVAEIKRENVARLAAIASEHAKTAEQAIELHTAVDEIRREIVGQLAGISGESSKAAKQIRKIAADTAEFQRKIVTWLADIEGVSINTARQINALIGAPDDPQRAALALTIVIPTKNRPVPCAAQLRFFRDCAVGYRIVVADSSDPTEAEQVRKACRGIADYHHFDPAMSMVEKTAKAIAGVCTHYIALAPDDDVTFPHAIDAALDALRKDNGYVAAGGKVLRFGMHENYIDIHGVFNVTPAINDDDPLRRHYQLMRGYRPFLWSVFRTPAFATAMNAAAKVEGTIFQEIAFMSMVALQGKIMQLPVVYAMRGGESSLMPRTEIDPFLWYLEDAGQFFGHFSGYRNGLIAAIKAMNISVPDEPKLKQLLGLAHGAWLGRVVDVGKINHTARVMLGDDLAPIYIGPEWAGWRAIAPADLVHASAMGQREYVWREAVASAQPKDEIAMSAAEMECVEKQLDSYSLT